MINLRQFVLIARYIILHRKNNNIAYGIYCTMPGVKEYLRNYAILFIVTFFQSVVTKANFVGYAGTILFSKFQPFWT